jgi:hypothetical protein
MNAGGFAGDHFAGFLTIQTAEVAVLTSSVRFECLLLSGTLHLSRAKRPSWRANGLGIRFRRRPGRRIKFHTEAPCVS